MLNHRLGGPDPVRILIVDDEPDLLAEYDRVLGGADACRSVAPRLQALETELFGRPADAPPPPPPFEISCCLQGEDAVDAVRRGCRDGSPFAVAFIDIVMPPGIDGVTAAERIRAIDPMLNIVFVTGFSDVRPEDVANKVLPVDKTLYCRKPVRPNELRQLAQSLSVKWLAERHLQEELIRHDQLLSSTSAIVYGKRGQPPFPMVYVSDNVIAEMGHWAEEFRADPRFWIDRVHDDDRARVVGALHALGERGELVIEYRFRVAGGEYRWYSDRVRLVRRGPHAAAEIVGCMVDITRQRRNEEEIRLLANFDPLTGLPNRRLLRDLLDHVIGNAVRFNRSAAVLLIDIDNFKNINESLGHPLGDRLLSTVSERLRAALRASDRIVRDQTDPISRLGGDEFVVVLSEIASAEDAASVARRLGKALERPIRLGQEEVIVTASIGISLFPIDGGDAETLLKHADTAMYQAKDEGRNRFTFFTPQLNQRVARRFSLERSLRRALDRGEFELHYQPKVDLQRSRLAGMEALVRWRLAEEDRLVPPADFIPVAEDSGLIVPIGDWVLGEACRQTAAWIAEGLHPLAVAVNLSALHFRQPNLAETICQSLSRAGLSPLCLELELTESILVQDVEQSRAVLQHLKDLGLSISIDDFGTGHSSLSYLKQFPLDALKIDRAFVRGIATDRDDAAIVGATIGLAHSLRLKVIAEGVEGRLQGETLRAQGCDEAQGFFFSLPAAMFPDWVKASGLQRRTEREDRCVVCRRRRLCVCRTPAASGHCCAPQECGETGGTPHGC
jgi:diguanylate cyclase (GGDEF)-like protein